LDDWILIQAARWAGVAPWELAAQPARWLNLICDVMEVEGELASIRRKERKNNGN
jgi:hypothetical protein